jgi:preprotein translocase subunit SecA
MAGFFSKLLRAGEGRQVKSYEKVAVRIGELEPSMQALSDEELAAKTIEFRERLERGEQLDDLLAKAAPSETNLARLRRLHGLSQSQLARTSGVGLKSIQAYEQRTNDINRASGQALHRLATALGCPLENLLEFQPQVTVEYLHH